MSTPIDVTGRDLQPGDRLDGGQLADGAGQTVAKILAPDAHGDDWVLLLTDGRPFIIDPDRLFRVRRLAL